MINWTVFLPLARKVLIILLFYYSNSKAKVNLSLSQHFSSAYHLFSCRSNCSIISQPKQREASRLLCATQPRTAWPWEADEVKYHCSVKANMSFDLECQLDAKEMWLAWPWSSSWLSLMQMCWSPWELQPGRTANLESIVGSSHRLELKPYPQLWFKKKQIIRKTPVFLIWLLRWMGE